MICPSLEEISDHFKIAVSSVFDHMEALEKKGVIERIPGQARSIRLTGEERQLTSPEPSHRKVVQEAPLRQL